MTSTRVDHPLQALLWQGSHVSDTPKIFAQITEAHLAATATALDDLIDLWTVARQDAKDRIQALQINHGIDFLVGRAWHARLAASATTFGDPQAYRDFLDDDNELHEEMSEMCAAEAMITIANMFQVCIGHLKDRLDLDPAAAFDPDVESLFDFAGLVNHADLGYDFVNNKVLPWIESHGVGAFDSPTRRDAGLVHETIMEDFKVDYSNVDECFDPDHDQGTKVYQCTMCVLKVVMTELRNEWNPANTVPQAAPLPAPVVAPVPVVAVSARGRGGGTGRGAGRGTGAGVGATRGTGAGRGRGRGGATAVAAATAAVAALGLVPAPAAPVLPPAAVAAAVAAANIIPAPAPVPPPPGPAPAPAAGQFPVSAAVLGAIASFNPPPVSQAAALAMPTFAQYRAQGNSHAPPAIADNLTPAAILARSAALTYDERPENIVDIGGFRYLCCALTPNGTPCGNYISRKRDLVRHFRNEHGRALDRNSAAEWAQMGPFNRLEMRVLRPWKTFSLRTGNDPAHMR